jgi:hypothetical protein
VVALLLGRQCDLVLQGAGLATDKVGAHVLQQLDHCWVVGRDERGEAADVFGAGTVGQLRLSRVKPSARSGASVLWTCRISTCDPSRSTTGDPSRSITGLPLAGRCAGEQCQARRGRHARPRNSRGESPGARSSRHPAAAGTAGGSGWTATSLGASAAVICGRQVCQPAAGATVLAQPGGKPPPLPAGSFAARAPDRHGCGG